VTPTEVALAYLSSFASGDPDRIAGWVTDNFVNNQMGVIGSCFQGRTLYRERLEGFLGRFPGLNYTVGDPVTQDDRVVLPYKMGATDQGRSIAINGVMVITVAGDRVARRDDYWDGLTYFQQIGIELPIGS
jgi:ketosteroid isomerase-like protein